MQNGVLGRMNITIVEGIRCMLSHAKLPKDFWGKAMMTVVDLINLSPSTILNGKVSKSFWAGKKVSYGHLKVFGCKTLIHIPKYERSKLDGKTKQCIFLAQGRDKFEYRLWDPVAKKIVRSRDVIFFKDLTIENIDNNEKTITSNEYLINLDPAPPPMVYYDDGGDVQIDNGDAINDDTPIVDDVNAEE